MKKAETIARDVAAMDAKDARVHVQHDMTPAVLSAYIEVETRPSLVALARKRFAERDPHAAEKIKPASGLKVRKPADEPSLPFGPNTEASFTKVASKVAEHAARAVEEGATPEEAIEVATNDAVSNILDRVENIVDPPVPEVEVDPTPTVPIEPPKGLGLKVRKPRAESVVEPAPKLKVRKPTPEPDPTPKAPRVFYTGFRPKAEQPNRSAWTDAEIAGAIKRYGQVITCTKCGAEGDLVTMFGLRRVNGEILKQPQCRACRRRKPVAQ